VTPVTCLFIVKENKNKRNIKSRKIDKRKRKNISVQAHYKSIPLSRFCLWRNLPPIPYLLSFLSYPISL